MMKEGRRLKSLDPFTTIVPYIMVERSDSQNTINESFDVSGAEALIRRLRQDGYDSIGILHIIIAAYVRTISQRPAVNRFIRGQKIYARNNIVINMAVKKKMSLEGQETTIKLVFEPSDTLYDVYDKVYSQLGYKQKFCNDIDDIKNQFIEQQLDENGYPWGKLYKLNIIRNNNLIFNSSLSMNEDHIFVLQYYCIINNLYIAPSSKYHYTVFDNSGRKLSAHVSSFNAIKLASLLFDEAIINLNKRWKFPSSYFINLKKKYVLSKRLYGIAALVREKRLSSMNDEMNYWRNNSYVPQTIYERFILFPLRRNLPSIVAFVVLYIVFGAKSFLPRNKTKLILNDLSRRSTVINNFLL